jgi:hypothetical protein
MLSVQTIVVNCGHCRLSGAARWLADSSKPGAPRKLVALTAGFCSIERGANTEPEILCMSCAGR